MSHARGVPSCGETGASHVQETSLLGMEALTRSVLLAARPCSAQSSQDPIKLPQPIKIHAATLTSWYLRGGENEEIKEAGRKGKH